MDDPFSKPGTALSPLEATLARVRRSAERERRIMEDDALNRIQPGPGEKAKAVWQGEGGSTGASGPLPTIYPRR